MLRLGVVGLDTTHGFIYPAMLNGYDPDRLTASSPEIVSRIFPTGGAPSVEAAHVVACFDADFERACRVAEACRIERVCSSLDAALVDVDGLLVCAGEAATHRRLATPAIEAGIPTFVDKPFTETSSDAEALVELADRRSVPLFCTSALRYAPQVIALQQRLPRTVGESVTAHVIGTGDFDSYAVHSLEMLIAVWGAGIVEVQSLGEVDHDTVQLTDVVGRRVLWQVCRRIDWLFHLSVFGSSGMDQALVRHSDRYTLFKSTAERIVEFFLRRESQVPLVETVEIVRVLEAARVARRDPRPVLVR